MFIFQKQYNFLEMLSGVHKSFKITKPNKFSNVQFFLKLLLTMVAINFRIYLPKFLTKKNYSQFYCDGLNPYCFGGWLGLMGAD